MLDTMMIYEIFLFIFFVSLSLLSFSFCMWKIYWVFNLIKQIFYLLPKQLFFVQYFF